MCTETPKAVNGFSPLPGAAHHPGPVKAANEAGGYGMLIGPHATKAECESFRRQVAADPRNYIAQPVISLSRHPTYDGAGVAGRHVDLRPFVPYGEKPAIIPGGAIR